MCQRKIEGRYSEYPYLKDSFKSYKLLGTSAVDILEEAEQGSTGK